MRKATLLGLVASLALALASLPAYGQLNSYVTGGRYVAQQYGSWQVRTLNGITSGAQTIQVDRCVVPTGNLWGKNIIPYAVNVPITIVDANTETVTPTAVTTPTAGSSSGCSITATFSNAHGAGATVTSGDGGLGEVITDIKGTGGVIVIDPSWTGSTSQITGSAIGGLPSSANIEIEDIRSSPVQYYSWNGSNAFVKSGGGGLGGVTAAFATATTAGTCATSTSTTIQGAAVGMACYASPATDPGAGSQWSCFVSASNTVLVRECAVATSAGGTIAFNVRVLP